MKTMNSKSKSIDDIAEGGILSALKQLAGRGNVRNFDENGVCGKMRLVVSNDDERFLPNVMRLFPGAPPVRCIGDDRTSRTGRILNQLNTTTRDVVQTRDLQAPLGQQWRQISKHILTPEFHSCLEAIGWRYVSIKGRGGARFERVDPIEVAEEADDLSTSETPHLPPPGMSPVAASIIGL